MHTVIIPVLVIIIVSLSLYIYKKEYANSGSDIKKSLNPTTVENIRNDKIIYVHDQPYYYNKLPFPPLYGGYFGGGNYHGHHRHYGY
jgi:hypothetical protein